MILHEKQMHMYDYIRLSFVNQPWTDEYLFSLNTYVHMLACISQDMNVISYNQNTKTTADFW